MCLVVFGSFSLELECGVVYSFLGFFVFRGKSKVEIDTFFFRDAWRRFLICSVMIGIDCSSWEVDDV